MIGSDIAVSSLEGRWIRDTEREDYVTFVQGYFDTHKGDVLVYGLELYCGNEESLCEGPYEVEMYLHDIQEYYEFVADSLGLEVWERHKAQLDKVFGVR